MKKQLQILSLAITFAMGVALQSNGQTLIHYWHFNNYAQGAMHTDTIHAVAADYSDLSVATANILYAEIAGTSPVYNSYVDSVQPSAGAPDYDTVNTQMSEPAGAALRVRNPSDSMQLYFYIPTTNFNNIVLSYGCESSSATHGMLQQVFDYSVDSGLTWRTSGLSIPSDSTKTVFTRTTVSFPADTQVNNNPKLVFRITFLGNNTGTSGNNRFDNVTVMGDSIGAVSPTYVGQLNANKLSYTVYPNPAGTTINISGIDAGDKLVMIFNELGQNVYTGSKNGKGFSLDVSALDAGNYYLRVRSNLTGKTDMMKFVKQ